MLLSKLSHVRSSQEHVGATIVEAMPCHSAMALGKNSDMRGERKSAMPFNTKHAEKQVAKTELRWRRRERKENRVRVLIFLNVGSTSIFNTKLMLTKVMLTLTSIFNTKPM